MGGSIPGFPVLHCLPEFAQRPAPPSPSRGSAPGGRGPAGPANARWAQGRPARRGAAPGSPPPAYWGNGSSQNSQKSCLAGLAFLDRRLSSYFWACCAPLPQSSPLPRRAGAVAIPPVSLGRGREVGRLRMFPTVGLGLRPPALCGPLCAAASTGCRGSGRASRLSRWGSSESGVSSGPVPHGAL